MAHIVIYTKPGCPFCHKAMKLLDEKGLHYKQISAAEKPSVRAEMMEKAKGRNTFPQILINDTPIGGCDDLFALENSGELDKILQKG